jgi:hypothetical protein
MWVELAHADAERFAIADGDMVRVVSPRGELEAQARVTAIREGVVFAPFHYGYWDESGAEPNGRPRAANELTITEWDPVSKQPLFKGRSGARRETRAMKLDRAIKDCQDAETDLAQQLRKVGERHAVEHDLYHLSHTLARKCEEHLERMRPFAERYGADRSARRGGDAAAARTHAPQDVRAARPVSGDGDAARPRPA